MDPDCIQVPNFYFVSTIIQCMCLNSLSLAHISRLLLYNSVVFFTCFCHFSTSPHDLRYIIWYRGAVAQWLEHRTGDRGVKGSNPGSRFGTLAIPFTPLCQCISEETLVS